jgi:hypothetical protein
VLAKEVWTLQSHLQSILLWLFWGQDLENYLPELALNLDPPNLGLPTSEDYRCEQPVPGSSPIQSLTM